MVEVRFSFCSQLVKEKHEIMLIYEVNLDIDPEIYDAYVAWLMPHVKRC